MITDLKVVNDDRANGPAGPWSFGGLMTELAGGADVSRFIVHWITQWESPQSPNNDTAPARPTIRDLIIKPWKSAGGQDPNTPDDQWRVDLSKAPFRLLAIVNRLDLMPAVGGAGEGRFVFCALDAAGAPLQFTIIFEFRQMTSANKTPQDWAREWHELGKIGFGNSFNQKLEAITRQFARRDSLNQVRTNENALNRQWELREFRLSSGRLMQSTVAQSPAMTHNEQSLLVQFMRDHEQEILTLSHVIPTDINGTPFLGSHSFTPFIWKGDSNTPSLVRHNLALTTCNGCHFNETGTFFLHVAPRAANAEAALSAFLTGGTTPDPVTQEPRNFNDLEERKKHLLSVLSGDPSPPAQLRPSRASAAGASARVH